VKDKPNVYVNPNAPQWLKDMLNEIMPDANKVTMEEMQRKIEDATGGINTEDEQ
jgi:hypothetical protein